MNNTVRTVQLPDESQVRDEVERIAAGPLAERALLAEILVTLRVGVGPDQRRRRRDPQRPAGSGAGRSGWDVA